MLALVGELHILHLGGGVDHVLLKRPVSPVVHAREVEIRTVDGASPLSTSIRGVIGE